ncbi:MAG: NAD-dependent epimerase/dehydratase family protein, partial [Bacteroidota bacterium]
HVAGYTKNWAKDPQEFYRQNVDGMQNVFDAAREARVQRVVFTSTIVTLGPSPRGEVRDESMPRITFRYFTEYEESKVVAERKAMDQAAAGFPVVIVNPTRVYGPGKLTEGNSVSLMIDMYDRGKVPVLLNGGVDVGNYVLVDDLVEGQILAMERGRIGERYILGGENASLKDIFRLVDEASGKKHFQLKLPPKVALLFGAIEKKKADWLGIYPQITPPWVETFLQDWAYTSAKAERDLGYRHIPLKEGIRRTYEWILEQRKKR